MVVLGGFGVAFPNDSDQYGWKILGWLLVKIKFQRSLEFFLHKLLHRHPCVMAAAYVCW